MKLWVADAVHSFSDNYLGEKKNKKKKKKEEKRMGFFIFEFHSWIKGRIEMESIIPPPHITPLPQNTHTHPHAPLLIDGDDAVPPRAHSEECPGGVFLAKCPA